MIKDSDKQEKLSDGTFDFCAWIVMQLIVYYGLFHAFGLI